MQPEIETCRQGASASDGQTPSWLLQSQDYQARGDNERFLHRNTRAIAGVLSRLKLQRGGLEDPAGLAPVDAFLSHVDSSLRIAGLLATIICVSAAVNMFFVYTVLAAFLVMLALKPGDKIVDILKPALAACALAAVIMLPALWLGQPASMARVSLKVFLSVGLVIALSREVAYNRLIAGMRAFHIPGLIIFILDIALKYIVMLGDVALGGLEALALRSVGRNDDKRGSSAGIMGITFLKAHDYASEMYEAMECRGFTGDYVVPEHAVLNAQGLAYLAVIVVEIVYFLLMEGII